MSIRTVTHKGVVRTNANGKKSLVILSTRTQYCFPEEIWRLIKEYWGFIPDFPTDFAEMYARFKTGYETGRVNRNVFNRVNLTLKRELGTLYHAPWFKEKMREHYSTGDCGDFYIPESETARFKEQHSVKFWMLRRKALLRDAYRDTSTPYNFTQCAFKVGDKVRIQVSIAYPIYFKTGGDKDNVVPEEDCVSVGREKSLQGKTRFRPRYRTQGGDGFQDFVPAIITAITPLKVKLEYYKYDIVAEVPVRQYVCDITYRANWTEPRGKIVVGWGTKDAFDALRRTTPENEIEQPTITFYNHPY